MRSHRVGSHPTSSRLHMHPFNSLRRTRSSHITSPHPAPHDLTPLRTLRTTSLPTIRITAHPRTPLHLVPPRLTPPHLIPHHRMIPRLSPPRLTRSRLASPHLTVASHQIASPRTSLPRTPPQLRLTMPRSNPHRIVSPSPLPSPHPASPEQVARLLSPSLPPPPTSPHLASHHIALPRTTPQRHLAAAPNIRPPSLIPLVRRTSCGPDSNHVASLRPTSQHNAEPISPH